MSLEKAVAVIGGGLAGLAVAVRLADAGYRPIVIESRKMLGGRATSVVDPRNNQTIDNCQHVLMGCCTNLIDLYDRLGVLDDIQWHRTLYWTRDGSEVSVMKAGWLPAPLHLSVSFMRMKLFDARQRRHIARAMWRIIRMGPGDRFAWSERTFAEFLESCAQPDAIVNQFWDVVVTSACNVDVHHVGAAYALQVFQQGFLEHRWSYTMGLATVPLVNLYDAAGAQLRDKGGTIMLGTSARSISFDGARVTGVVTASGFVDAAAVVSAVPFDRLDKLVSATTRDADTRLRDLAKLSVSPILGVHLWFDQPVMKLPHLVLVDAGVQWLFNKGTDPNGRQHVHAVISAADDWMALSEQQITEKVVADIHRGLPGSVGIEPIQTRCIKEKRATFKATPGADAFRPPVAPAPARGPAIENLYLAGDWCDTGWPATMEGAVRSGYAAAAEICRKDGIESEAMVDDVPASWLARLLRRR